jgi:MFS transporter, FSR family, fosmidomycin resistance protein
MTTASLPAHSATPIAQDAKIMGLVGLAHASSHFGHMLLPPLFPVFIQEFGLSFAQVGLLMSVFFVVSGVGQALSGFVVFGLPGGLKCARLRRLDRSGGLGRFGQLPVSPN